MRRAAVRGWRSARALEPASVPFVVATPAPMPAPAPVLQGVEEQPAFRLRDTFPSFGVFALLLFMFVIISAKLPLGEAAVIGALVAPFLQGRGLRLPLFYIYYLVYVILAAIGLATSEERLLVELELDPLVKVAVIGIATVSILRTRKDIRGFVFGYLAIYALYPIRGSLFNYAMGIAPAGRIAWNFIFENPNDLAIICLLPLGLCGYFLLTEKRSIWRTAALIGLVIIFFVVLLTQSRGALVGLGVAFLYYLTTTKQKTRALLGVASTFSIAAIFAPGAVWERMAGLSNASVTSMSAVDREGSAEARWAILTVAVDVIRDNPWKGVGIGVYPQEHYQRALQDPTLPPTARGPKDTHNTYLRAAAETGLPGMACILLFSFSAIAYCRKVRKQLVDVSIKYQHALLALEVSMVAFAVAAFFGSMERVTFFTLQFLVPWTVANALQRELLSGTNTAAARRS